MATLASVPAAPVVSTIPALPGLPLLGNLPQFLRDRLGLHEAAALLGPITRIQVAHVPIYVITDADLAHAVLVDHAGQTRKSAGIRFMEPLLGNGLLSA